MIDFLIKSTASLIVLLAVYHLFLEKEKMHQFNRFFLLFSLVFSFSIPFYTIEIIKKIAETPIPELNVIDTVGTPVIQQDNTNYLQLALYIIYSIITATLLIRFIYNLHQFNKKKQNNPSIQHENTTVVLLEETTLPYTFLNTIFMNKSDYESKKIEPELFTHELIHVNQKHTLDILCVEILKTIFWFNPVFIFYKKAIQLNHEFLADEKVVQSHNNVPFYQNLLITKANANPTYYLASNLNYSVTKKRLIMMTKTTSYKQIFIKKTFVLPILTGLVFLLCTKTVAEETTQKAPTIINTKKTDQSTDQKRDRYYAGVRVLIKDSNKNIIINKVYEDLTPQEKKNYLNYVPEPYIKKQPSDKEYNNFKDSKKYAIWIDGKNTPNSKLNDYKPSDFVYFSGSSVYKNARSVRFPQPFQFTLYTEDYFNKNLKNAHLKFSGKTIEMMVGNKQRKAIPQPTVQTKEVVESLNKKVVNGENDLYSTANVEKKPEFPGGMETFYQFVDENYKVPEQAKLPGRVYISFVIEKDGSLSNFKMLKDIGYGTGNEAVRVLKISPNWIPAEMKGKPVRCTFTLPIPIQPAK